MGVSPLDRYVAELDRALHGPRRLRRDLVREARDHLIDASEALMAKGAAPQDAEVAATRSFGTVEQVAPGYQALLAAGHGRRTALLLFAVTLPQPVAWSLVHDEARAQAGTVRALNTVVESVGMVSLAAALALMVLGGLGVRWFGVRRSLARTSGLATLALGISLTASGAALFVAGNGTTSWEAVYFVVIALVPFCSVIVESTRCLRSVGLRSVGPRSVGVTRDLPRPEVRT